MVFINPSTADPVKALQFTMILV